MKSESLLLFPCICRWAGTDRPKLPRPTPIKARLASVAHLEKAFISSCRSCPALPRAGLNVMPGCTKGSTELPPEYSRLLLCQPGAWAEALCCLHPPAQTGRTLAIIRVCALIPSDWHGLFKGLDFLWVEAKGTVPAVLMNKVCVSKRCLLCCT